MTREEAMEIVKKLYNNSLFLKKDKEAMLTLVPELAENDDERIRKAISYAICAATHQDGTLINHVTKEEALAWFEKQKYQEPTNESNMHEPTRDEARKWNEEYEKGYSLGYENGYSLGYENGRNEQKPVHTAKEMWKEMRRSVLEQTCGNCHEPNYADASTKMFSLCDIDEIFEKIGNSTVGSQTAESDAIKGGDFISDGKRVFLVLANVKERNLGETGSTFCEGHILGVDGVVYCDGDNFKKFKRATSDERAKFIHDLKVGVELKEQPADWSEEEKERIRQNGRLDVCYNPEKYGLCHKTEWSEEDEEMLEDIKFNFVYNKEKMTDALIAQYNCFFDKIKSLSSGCVREQHPIEDCDYGLEIALDILVKTLNKVQGYQTDDGIREHQTAIQAVKDAMKPWFYPYGKNEIVDKLIGIAECLEMDGDCSFNGMSGNECGRFLRDLARKQTE